MIDDIISCLWSRCYFSSQRQPTPADHALQCHRNSQMILILDTIGMLSSVYQYADISYIGGGFGKGIHNILETAVFGNPIIFGPNHTKFGEAVELKGKGGAIGINNKEEFGKVFLTLLEDKKKREEKGAVCKQFVAKNKGATQEIINTVF